MIEENNMPNEEAEGFSTTRRALLKAAWTVPAVMAIGTVPAYARSGSICDEGDDCDAQQTRIGGFGEISNGGYVISSEKVSGL